MQSWDPGCHDGENAGTVLLLQYVTCLVVVSPLRSFLLSLRLLSGARAMTGLTLIDLKKRGRYTLWESAPEDEMLRGDEDILLCLGRMQTTYPNGFPITNAPLASDLLTSPKVLCKLVSRLAGGRARRVAAAQGPPNRHRSKTPQDKSQAAGVDGPPSLIATVAPGSALNCNWQTSTHLHRSRSVVLETHHDVSPLHELICTTLHFALCTAFSQL